MTVVCPINGDGPQEHAAQPAQIRGRRQHRRPAGMSRPGLRGFHRGLAIPGPRGRPSKLRDVTAGVLEP